MNATVNGTGNYLTQADIMGSPESKVIQDYYDATMPLQARLKDIEKMARMAKGEDQVAAKESAKSKMDSLATLSLDFAQAHKNTLAALCALEGLDAVEHKDLSGNADGSGRPVQRVVLFQKNQAELQSGQPP